jgi:hypothetical protein
MDQQERQALQEFLHELLQARINRKDPEADAMINQAIARQPDAPYLLVQRTLLQGQALDVAQRQIAALQAELDSSRASGTPGFLDPSSSWGRSGSAIPRAGGAQPMGQGVQAGAQGGVQPGMQPSVRPGVQQDYAPGGYAAPVARSGFLGGGGGSFLGSMAAAAAGVAAGSFLFHGIDQMMHPHGAAGADNTSGRGLADVPPDQEKGNDLLADAGSDSGDIASDAGLDDIGSLDDAGGGDDSSY